jgi:hypothetical protein
MEHLHHEHKTLTEEIRILKKIANATKVAHTCRKRGDELAANCIESLIREIERGRERHEANTQNSFFRTTDGE